jgi:hypothetical protein
VRRRTPVGAVSTASGGRARRRERARFARALALALLDGAWSRRALASRAERAGIVRRRAARKLAARLTAVYRTAPHDRLDELTALVLAGDEVDDAVRLRHAHRQDDPPAPEAPIERWRAPVARTVERRWDVPPIDTMRDLARFFDLSISELEFLADRRGMLARPVDPHLVHYDATWIPKPSGGARLIEAPRSRLAMIQRRILRTILERVPPHGAAHGFVRGRGVRTFVAPHAAHAVVLRLDLEDFFAHVSAGRALGIFRTAGYPEEVARTLTALTTTRTAHAILRAAPAGVTTAQRMRLRGLHLPQGAPTSPMLATLAAFRLDVRLDALALAAGGRYGRYADDLAFSFDRPLRADRLVALVAAIAREEGFAIAPRKTRIMRRGTSRSSRGSS